MFVKSDIFEERIIVKCEQDVLTMQLKWNGHVVSPLFLKEVQNIILTVENKAVYI